MEKVAKFEKVSLTQFDNSMFEWGYTPETIEKMYNKIILPKRATVGSAGYDFYLPMDMHLKPGEILLFPTGIRCKIQTGWVLQLYPRSGLGFRYGLQLRNTVGIIDSDYYGAHNEGHIMAKIVNTGDDQIFLPAGSAFMQGLFVPFGITEDDTSATVRTGGFGSTDSIAEQPRVA